MVNVCGRDRPRSDCVQRSVVRLAHDRIDRSHVLHSGHAQQFRRECICRAPHTQRARQQDRCLELAQLLELRGANQLAECVPDEYGCRNAIEKHVAAVRKDRCHTCVYRIASDHCRLSDEHAGDVGNCVLLSRREYAGCDAKRSCANAGFLRVEHAGG